MLRSVVTTVAGNVGVLSVNLMTGVLSARLLGPEGRGTFAAVSVFVVIAAVIGQTGLSDAGTYFTARQSDRARSIASTCAVMMVGLATVTSGLAMLVVPYVFAAQPQSTVDLARLAVLAVGAVMAMELGLGLTAGLRQFNRLALSRLFQPLLFLLGLVTLAVTGRATPGSVLAVLLGSYACAAAVILLPLVLGPGRRRPERSLAASLAGYGIRLQGQIVGDVGNTRLDLAVLPAVIAAAQIGLYSVAVSVASIIIALFSTLGRVLSPLASTGDPAVAMRMVERTTRVVLLLAAVCAVGLALTAPWLVSFAYGDDYVGSVVPLRLLLPGCVCWGSSYLLAGGLRAVGKPGSTSLAQLGGLLVTVPGLALTLPRFGIAGAAATSSVAYVVVFLLMARSLSRHSPFHARALCDAGELRRDLAWLWAAARARAGAGAAGGAAVPHVGEGPADGHATIYADPEAGPAPVPTVVPPRKDTMPRSTRPMTPWVTGALVIVPALIGATAAGLVGLATVDPQHRATAVVQLSEIAGNSSSGQLNPYAADLNAALQSALVGEQVEQALGPDDEAGSLEVERLPDSSRVSVSLQADIDETARTAVLAAGRAAYAALVEQQVQLLQVRERAALARLETLGEQVAAARAALAAAPVAETTSAASLVQQNERLQSIAVDELSQVQGQLAVVAELRAEAPTTTAVSVDSVEAVSRLPQLLPIFGAGFVGGAIPGAALVLALRRRRVTGGRDDLEDRSLDCGTSSPAASRRTAGQDLRGPDGPSTPQPLREPAGEVPAR